jgi:hypothetical protein
LKKSDVNYGEMPYMVKVTVGIIYTLRAYFPDENYIAYSDAIVYLNAVGIVYLLIHSIWLRKYLISFNRELDEDVVSPSDFTIIARQLPRNLTPDQFKEKFEKQFSKYGVKVASVNYCYNIEKMYACNR